MPRESKGDADWKDLLTAFDGQSITYDASGNPTSYYNGKRWTMSWVNGRQLASASDGTNTYSYIYDAAGSRIMKNVGTVNHLYFYVNGMLLMEYRYNAMGDTTDVLQYFYDANGKPHAMAYNGTVYLYVTNLQGDIVALLGMDGTISGYEYDPYGNVIASFGDIAAINPLRYRGYYYDNETGLYYLQSRYYDPVIGRFINADDTAYLGADGTLLSYNLFAYCKNNPVMGYDPTGHFGLTGAIIATGTIVGGLLGAFSAATTGGNILESAIEGCLTGALGAACGLLIPSPGLAVIAAGAGGAVIDFATQATTQYIQNKSVNFSEIDGWRVVKTAAQTGIGTAVPKFGQGAGNAVDAFGTALMWAEASTMIVCADVIVTNTVAAAQSSSKSVSRNRRGVSILEREMLLS